MNSFCSRTAALLLVFAAYCAPPLTAQSPDSIYVTVEHATLLQEDSIVNVRVFAKGVPEMVAFQLSLTWAGDELSFQRVNFGSIISNSNNASSNVRAGDFRAVSFSPEVTPISLQGDSLILTLELKTLPGFSGNTPIFSDLAITTEFTGVSGMPIPHTVQQGFVSYGEPGMRTRFSEPYPDAVVSDQFCVDLEVIEAYAIAGFDLDLNWDATTFPLAEVKLGDNPLRFSAEEVPFSATLLAFDRRPEDAVKFPAILQPTTVANICFTTSAPDAVSNLNFGGRDGTTVYGYSPTGEVMTVANRELNQGTISQPEATSVFAPAAPLPALKLYPNPVKDILTLEGIDSNRRWEATLQDELGRLISLAPQGSNTLNLTSLKPGVYTLSVVQENKRWLNRIVVVNR